MQEKLRKKKQDELLKIGKEMTLDQASIMPEGASTIAYLSDPKNYQAIREKQEQLKKR